MLSFLSDFWTMMSTNYIYFSRKYTLYLLIKYYFQFVTLQKINFRKPKSIPFYEVWIISFENYLRVLIGSCSWLMVIVERLSWKNLAAVGIEHWKLNFSGIALNYCAIRAFWMQLEPLITVGYQAVLHSSLLVS